MSRSLRSRLAGALVAPFVGTAVVGVAATLAQPVTMSADVVAVPSKPDRAAVLLERHGCWTGEAPASMRGRLPGHVVVTWAGSSRPAYGGERAVKAALTHVFGNEHRGMVVHGFCR